MSDSIFFAEELCAERVKIFEEDDLNSLSNLLTSFEDLNEPKKRNRKTTSTPPSDLNNNK